MSFFLFFLLRAILVHVIQGPSLLYFSLFVQNNMGFGCFVSSVAVVQLLTELSKFSSCSDNNLGVVSGYKGVVLVRAILLGI